MDHAMFITPAQTRHAAVFALFCWTLASGPPAVAQVNADPGVSTSSYASFTDLEPPLLWEHIQGTEFWGIPLAPPQGYYDEVDFSSAAEMRESLHEVIEGHAIYPYSHSSRPGDTDHRVDTWDIIALADAHPENPNRVIDLYFNNTFDRQLVGVTTNPRYDREHSWPKSLGFPDNAIANAAYSDCHHLFAAYRSYNGSRSNKPYGNGDQDAERRRPTVENLGRGGSLTDDPESSNFSYTDVWETWMGRRGDVARAMFYMDLRYEGGTRDGVGEPQLQLTNDPDEVVKLNVWSTSGTASMGFLEVLLQWHEEDPVDDLERRRNTVVYLFQGNRNPFVDHPEWVSAIYSDDPGPVVVTTVDPWINEFHYDNEGADLGEFVEVAGPAGLDLNGWTLVAYNGNGGTVYATERLEGVLPDQQGGKGTLEFPFDTLQNGPADGLALVSPSGTVVEFLSYEGVFSATEGPAQGMAASVIPVEESGTTLPGHSLQRGGAGAQGGDFTWLTPRPATPGLPNDTQSFLIQ